MYSKLVSGLAALSFLSLAASAQVLLHDNGPYVTQVGVGALLPGNTVASDVSEIEPGDTLFGSAASAAFSIANDIDVPAGGTWTLTSVKVPSYQTQAALNTTSTFTAAFVRVYQDTGALTPAGATLIGGDTTTNRLTSSTFTNCFRVQTITLTNIQRALFENTIDLSFLPTLAPGKYWIEVNFTGSIASGPWIPPVCPHNVPTNGEGAFQGTLTSLPVTYAATVSAGGWNSEYPFKLFGTSTQVPQPVTYCTAGTTTNGCVASIGVDNGPSVSLANPCNITVTTVEGNKSGLIFYTVNGQNNQAWNATSFLCVKSPTQRTPTQTSTGTAGQCDGTLSLDWNAYQSSTPGAVGQPWSAGDVVQVQAWFRDPPAGKATNLSNALEMTYAP